MYDFLEKNAMYIVLLIALIIWIGLFLYMFRLDSRIKKLEKEKKPE
ncbi:MAG: CcmD family protein [Ignavibacteriae bacterium]|nr:CcmD family protein [Ignavibacteriota bacterium]